MLAACFGIRAPHLLRWGTFSCLVILTGAQCGIGTAHGICKGIFLVAKIGVWGYNGRIAKIWAEGL